MIEPRSDAGSPEANTDHHSNRQSHDRPDFSLRRWTYKKTRVELELLLCLAALGLAVLYAMWWAMGTF